MTRRLHPVWSLQRPRDKSRDPHIAVPRDGIANSDMLGSLVRNLGFDYGEPLLNFRSAEPGGECDGSNGLSRVDLSFARSGDCLLYGTRPPINEHLQPARKASPPAATDLEQRIFDVWASIFDLCARNRVRLNAEMARQLSPDFDNRRDIVFYQNGDSRYKHLRTGHRWQRPGNPRLTAAYLLVVDELPGGGPGLINPFGMDALVTLAWCYRLGRDFAHLLREPGFTLVEIEMLPVRKQPGIPHWAREWRIETLVHTAL